MIVYSKRFLDHHLDGHPESRDRLESIIKYLHDKGVFDVLPLNEPEPALEEDILRVHSKSHLERMKTIARERTQILGDTYFTVKTYSTALLAAGGVITCVKSDQPVSFALVRPPGHHATRDSAMGFCIFNNTAVAAAYAREAGTRRLAILDLDLHHGNGTQDIFYQDEVLYISLHQYPHYPGSGSVDEIGVGRGKGFTVNIPLPGGVGDESYGFALNEIVYPVLREFSPELLIVSAGYDGHYTDPLGNLRLSTKTYFETSRELKDISDKVVFTLEGGYNLHALPGCVHATIRGLFELEGEGFFEAQKEDPIILEYMTAEIESIKKKLSPFWRSLC